MQRWLVLACWLLAMLAGLRNSDAQSLPHPEAVERQVKAAYLYKFGSYVEWPERTFDNPLSPITIGVLAADALADELTQVVAGRTINGHPVMVHKLRREESVKGLNVLFIGRLSNTHLADTLAAAKGQPILVITESEAALTLGSIINFVIVDGKVRFEVAPKTAGLNNLSISARLLAAAYKVAAGAS